MPLPRSPIGDLEAELAELRATAAARARAEIDRCLRRREEPIEHEVEEQLRASDVVDRLAVLVEVLWEACVASWWPRIRQVLDHDIMRRSRGLASGGLAAVFEGLDPLVKVAGARFSSAIASSVAIHSGAPACCSCRRCSSGHV
jgi:hypothetical protein